MKVEIQRHRLNRTGNEPYKWEIHYGRDFIPVTQEDMALLLLGGPFSEMEDETIGVLADDGFLKIDRYTEEHFFTIKGKELQTTILKRLVVIDDRIHYRKDLPL